MTTQTKKKAAKKTAKTAMAKVTPTPEEQAEAKAAEIGERLSELEATITQREWLLICRQLDYSREQIQESGSLRILALAWVRQKREHGGSQWERILECTDDELLEILDIDQDELDAAAQDAADPTADQADSPSE